MKALLLVLLVGCHPQPTADVFPTKQVVAKPASCLRDWPSPPIPGASGNYNREVARLVMWALVVETLCRAPFANMGGVRS